jgi:SAM-dependent methyltransferase
VSAAALPAPVLYGRLLAAGAPHLGLRHRDGRFQRVPTAGWLGHTSAADDAIAAALDGPVLDVGCGPGRLLQELNRLGVAAMGVDVSPDAVRIARSRGGRAVTGSVFDDVPGAGEWATALLLDGNIGIGGDPAALLVRVRSLLRPGGAAVVEVEPDGVPVARWRVRLEHAGTVSDWFWWARVGLDGLPDVAADAGLAIADVRGIDGRWFAWLERP